jgi:hypothetical protein
MAKLFHSVAIPKRLIIAGIFLSAGSTVYGQVQGMHPFDNRIEGTNVHLNALQDFTLIAIHRNFQLFPRNANLSVRFFLPQLAGDPAKKVFVEAVELQDSFHYFMQVNSSIRWKDGTWNVFAPWPTRDVIDPLGLESKNVGVLAGYRIGNDRPVYLPVDVFQNDGQPPAHIYTFHLITGQDLQSLDISLTNAAGAAMNLNKPRLKCKTNFNPNCKLYAAGGLLAFDLDMSLFPTGEYHLKLVGRVPGTLTPTSLEIVLYHHP